MVSTLNKQKQSNNKKSTKTKQQKLIQAPAQYVTNKNTFVSSIN